MSRFVNLEFEENFGPEHETTPKDEAFYLAEAHSNFKNAEFEKALRYYAKVLEFNPENAVAWTGQVKALIELEEFREAKLWADKALERFPREPELLAAKAVALGRMGELDTAMAFSDASIEERGDTPYVWLARGDVLLAREERRADYCFDKALLLARHDWFVAWMAARIRYYYKQFTAALVLAQKAVEASASEVSAWITLGLCQREMGMVAPARISFAQALQLNPQSLAASEAIASLSNVGFIRQLFGLFRRP